MVAISNVISPKGLTRLVAVLFLLLSLIIVGCKSETSETGAADKVVSAETSSVESEADSNKENIDIHLISSGEEPRQLLRYALLHEQAADYNMKMKMDIGMKIDDTQMPVQSMPWITTTMGVSSSKIDESSSSINALYKDIKVESDGEQISAIVKAMEDSMAFLKGIEINYSVDSKGNVGEIEVVEKSPMPPQVKQMITQMNQSLSKSYVLFPDEAIGVGGKWKNHMKDFDSGGLKVDLEATYLVKSLSKDGVELEAEITTLVKEQLMPSTPQAGEIKVLPSKNVSKSTIRINFSDVMPESDLEQNFKQLMEVSMPTPPASPPADGSNQEETTKKQLIETDMNMIVKMEKVS